MVGTLSSSCYNPYNLLQLAEVFRPSYPLMRQCIHRIMEDLLLNYQTQCQNDWQPPMNINKEVNRLHWKIV